MEQGRVGDGLDREFGLGRGKVFPASRARSLVSPLRRLVQSPGRTVAAIGLDPWARVLEVGSGPGFFSPFIAAAVWDGSVVMLDLQPEMLRLGRERVEGGNGIGFVCGDGQRHPFGPSAFDAVFIATVLGEVPDRHACLEEVRRVLRPGGVAAFSGPRRDSDFLALGKLRPEVESLSFSFLDRKGTAWQYVARFRAS